MLPKHAALFLGKYTLFEGVAGIFSYGILDNWI